MIHSFKLFLSSLVANTDDYAQLDRALQCCKDLLEYVNQAVREADNRQRLHEISKKMDATPYERVTKGNPDEVCHLSIQVLFCFLLPYLGLCFVRLFYTML